MLQPDSAIVRMGFESGPKGFDDIWAEYREGRGPNDPRYFAVRRSHLQCKYHVTHGTYGHADLVEPAFINAETNSLLQRARDAQLMHAPDGTGARFDFMTNWFPSQSDPLGQLIRRNHGGLDLKKLFDGSTDRSAVGKVRKLWREHLKVNEEELQLLTQTLAFYGVGQSLSELREQLNLLLRSVGLRQIPGNSSSFIYDDLPFQWLVAGRLEFDRNTLIQACKKEGLLEAVPPRFISFGVKSFVHPIDRLEDRCTEVLDLVPQFDERTIREVRDWAGHLYPTLRTFLLSAAKGSEQIRLSLDTHATLAFAAGSVLDVKSGRHVELEQRSHGYKYWSQNDQEFDLNWPKWKFENTQPAGAGADLAVVVSATHDIAGKVRSYMAQALPDVTHVITVIPEPGASNTSVVCGHHAYQLAESLAAEVRKVRQPSGKIHLFLASPNALTFFIGQRQPLLGPIVLYEFDFEGLHGGSYTPSLSLPIQASVKTSA